MSQRAVSRSEERITRQAVRVCDAVGAFIEYWGFKSVHGRVWALLALADEPMAQSEIAATLAVSRSLISGAVSELSGRGLVARVGDHRNAPYEAVVDVWPVIADVLRSREWMLIERARVALEAAVEEAELAAALGHPVRWNVERMKMLLAMTEMAQALLKILTSLRLPRSGERFSAWFERAAAVTDRLRQIF